MPATPSQVSHVGLVGGTFNPIHRGHLAVARAIHTRLGFERMLFVPTGDPPHKRHQDLASAAHRLAMVRLAVESEPGFEVSDIEVRRSGRSYTIDTITELQARAEAAHVPQRLSLCLGLDAFLDIESWHRADELLRRCDVVVVSRPGVAFARLRGLTMLPPLDPSRLAAMDAGHADSAAFPLPGDHTLTLLTIPPCPVSASMVRTRIAQGLPMDGLLPPPVERYILRERLYQELSHPTRFQG